MRNRKKHGLLKGFAVAMGAMLAVAAPAAALGNVFASSDNSSAKTTKNAAEYELVDNMQDASILHCWNWSYETIEKNLQLIAECGYSAVQTSPATQPKDYMYDGEVGMEVGIPGMGGSGNWWKVYQPVTYSVCDNGQTWFGTKEDLERLCAKAEEYGIKVIVDVVANHMGNIKGWQNSLEDVSPQVGEYWDENMMTDEGFWHINDLQIWMSDSRLHFTQGSMGMPDLNTADERVQKYIRDYLIELIDCGVDGFRFDAAKHIETPDDDPSFASDFWPNVLNPAYDHYKAETGENLYVYGEILNTVGDNFSINSYTKYMSVTDNSAGNHLFEAIRNSNAGNLNLNYPAEKSVIWAESHDTYMNESSRYGSDMSVLRTWAIVANKDNAAKLFFVRPYDSDDVLIDGKDGQFRGDLKTSLTPAIMGECPTYSWASYEAAAINHFNNRFVNCPDNIGIDGSVTYCQRGQGIVLVNLNGPGNISMSSHGLADGTYTDEVTGNTFTVSGGVIRGNIGSEYGIAVVYQNVMPNPGHNYAVSVAASVADGTFFYSDELEVTLTAKYADTAFYTVSTGVNGTFTGEKTIKVGAGLKAGDAVTVTVKGSNGSGSAEKTYTYIKAEYNLENCVFFKNTKGFSNVTAYLWNDTGATVKNNAAWPGEAMFLCDEANGIYALAVDPTANYNKIIFSNSGSSQTADLDLAGIGYCYDASTGTWSEYGVVTPPVIKQPVISVDVAPSTIKSGTEVTITVENAKTVYYSVFEGYNGNVGHMFTGKSETVRITGEEGSVMTLWVQAIGEAGTVTEEFKYTIDYTQPTVSASVDSKITTDKSLTVTFTAENAKSATITVNGVAENFTGSVTKTFTADSTVVVKAVNGTKSAEKTYTYKFENDDDDKESTEIFFDVTACGWFGNDKAVAAVKFNTESAYKKCDTVTVNGKTYYKIAVPEGAKSLSICRMLPSGDTYNAVTVTLTSGKNLWSANSGLNGGTWSQNDALGKAVGGGDDKKEDTMTVYFVNNYGWNGTVKAYFWGSEAQSVSWPGVEMTAAGKDSNGNAMYKIVIPTDIVGLIFTNGSTQTVDITTNLKDGAVFSVSGNSGSKCNVSVK